MKYFVRHQRVMVNQRGRLLSAFENLAERPMLQMPLTAYVSERLLEVLLNNMILTIYN